MKLMPEGNRFFKVQQGEPEVGNTGPGFSFG